MKRGRYIYDEKQPVSLRHEMPVSALPVAHSMSPARARRVRDILGCFLPFFRCIPMQPRFSTS
jgi:hypothetical protein